MLPFRECVMYVHDYSYLWPILVELLYIFLQKPVHYMLYMMSPHLSRLSKLFKCTFNFTIDNWGKSAPHTGRVIEHIITYEYRKRSCLSLFLSLIFNFPPIWMITFENLHRATTRTSLSSTLTRGTSAKTSGRSASSTTDSSGPIDDDKNHRFFRHPPPTPQRKKHRLFRSNE